MVVLGSPTFVAKKLTQRLREQDRLLQQLPPVPRIQPAWL